MTTIALEGLTKRFGPGVAVGDLSLNVAAAGLREPATRVSITVDPGDVGLLTARDPGSIAAIQRTIETDT